MDLTDFREEEEMVEISDSMGKEAVELLREAVSWYPCPSGREGESERLETWRAREREAELMAKELESAAASRATVAAKEAAPSAGVALLAGRRLPKQ